MKALLVIVGLAGLAIAETHVKEGTTLPVAANSTEPKKLRTFRAALHDAMSAQAKGDKGKDKKDKDNKGKSEDNRTAPAAPPRVYFEVIRVNERVVVNDHNQAKDYTASMNNALFSLESGKLRRLYTTKMLVKPKPGSRLFKSITGQRSLGESDKPDKTKTFKEWLDDLAYKLQLDHFWPRLLFSIVCGFFCTALIYLAAWCIMSLYAAMRGYDPIAFGVGEGRHHRQHKSASAENLLKTEQARAKKNPPVIHT